MPNYFSTVLHKAWSLFKAPYRLLFVVRDRMLNVTVRPSDAASLKETPRFILQILDQASKDSSLLSGCRVENISLLSRELTFFYVVKDYCLSFLPSVTVRSKLLGYAIAGKVSSDTIARSPSSGGWEAIVKQMESDELAGNKTNTLVGLFIFVDPRARGAGVANKLINSFKSFASALKLETIIIPLLLPSSTDKKYCYMDIEEYYLNTDNSGNYSDYWLRLHCNNGAEVIRHEKDSHCYKVTLPHLFKSFLTGVHLHVHSGNSIIVEENGRFFALNLESGIDFTCRLPCVWVRYQVQPSRY